MKVLSVLTSACLLAASASLLACGDDDDNGNGVPSPMDAGTGVPGDGSVGPNLDSSMMMEMDAAMAPDAGGPGDGSTMPQPTACNLGFEGKPEAVIPNPTGNLTLTSDKVWKIEGITYVGNGTTLTVEPCTRIEGKPLTGGVASALVVERGGKLNAAGTADAPILFTGETSRTVRAPGNWGGVILLGRAPNNIPGGEGLIEGLLDDPRNRFGGSDPADNSGVLTYVRIEDSGYELMADIEINGLTLGSVGNGTTIHHVMVVNNLDDCFEWFGGTVNANHLIADACGDDMFDTDKGFSGTLHTLLGRQKRDVISSSDPNGYEADGNGDGFDLMPFSAWTGDKVTLCGIGMADANVSYGGVLRRGTRPTLTNNVITGFDDGISLRDNYGTLVAPVGSMTNSMMFGNFRNNIGEVHSTSMPPLDPNTWFTAGAGNTVPMPPPFALADCQAAGGPNATVTGSGVGAFKDEAAWAQGAWVAWTTFQ